MLDVYLHDALVGVVSRDARGLLSFRYGERALDEPASSMMRRSRSSRTCSPRGKGAT
jgi:hypothetical protein